MTKTELIRRDYNALSGEDRNTFNRWLMANAAVGCLLTLCLFAMAMFAGSSYDAALRDQTASTRSTSTVGMAQTSYRFSDREHVMAHR